MGHTTIEHKNAESFGDIESGQGSRVPLSFAGVQRIPSWLMKPRAIASFSSAWRGNFCGWWPGQRHDISWKSRSAPWSLLNGARKTAGD
jgi:hypothetical protein